MAKSGLRALCTLLGIMLLAGCAISYQNGGKRTILGLAWVEYRTSETREGSAVVKIGKEAIGEAAPLVQQKSLGFYLDVSRNSPGVGFGYRDVIVVVPEVNAETLVDYNTADPLSASLKVTRKE